MFAVAGERRLLCHRRACEHRCDFRAGFEQASGLAVDHLEITLLGGVGIVRIHELQHFAFGNHVGRIRHDLHDPL